MYSQTPGIDHDIIYKARQFMLCDISVDRIMEWNTKVSKSVVLGDIGISQQCLLPVYAVQSLQWGLYIQSVG